MNNKKLPKAVCRVVAALSLSFVCLALPLEHEAGLSLGCFATPAQAAEDSWKEEFEAVCSQTNDSVSLSREELQALIVRCEKLKPIIAGQEETARKVYGKRLEMCKNLLVFVLETKK